MRNPWLQFSGVLGLALFSSTVLAETVEVRFGVDSQSEVAAQATAAGTPEAAAAAFNAKRGEFGRELRGVQREVPEGMSALEAAIRASVDGPTAEEAAAGLISHLPPGTKLVDLLIEGDTVTIDLSPQVLKELDDQLLESLFNQLKATIGDFPEILAIRLTCKGVLLSEYLAPAPEVEQAPETVARSLAIPAEPMAVVAAAALTGRKVTIGPSHGRYYNGSGWYWQRSDPCGLGEAVLEDTNSVRLMQFLYQYLVQDGVTVTVPRDLNESDCCHSGTGLPWWKMASRYWLQYQGLPASVWDSSTTDLNDDIRARPLYADYVGADIYIAHHTNAGASGTARGTETFRDTAMEHPTHEANSLTLANNVQNNVISAIRDMYDSCWVSRGVKDAAGGFGEIRIPNRPAILIELAFHDGCNPSSVGCGKKDTDALTSNYFRSVSQWGIYKGICGYFGVAPTWDKYSNEIVSDTIPSSMLAGNVYNVSVTMRNRGVLWSNAYSFRLGAVGDSDPFTAFTRVNISGEVRPGNTYTFSFQMTAPSTPNTYTSDWRMVRDGVAWFGPTLTKTITVTSPDTQPPTVPGNLMGMANSPTSVQLNWTASTDNIGVVGYEVRRNGATIGSPTTNSYTDNTAVANTAYTYEVRAKDAIPNYSAWSNTAAVTTPASAPGTYIVESRTGGLNFAKYSEIGTFANTAAKSTAAGLTAGIGGRYGSANIAVAGSKRAFFNYDAPTPGVYQAYITSGNQSSRNTNVQVVISHALGNTTTSFDEVANTNLWFSLGQFNFNTGTNTGTIEMNNNNGNAAGANVNVDAVRWVFVSYLATPSAPISGGDQTICAGGTATLTATVAAGQTVDWYTGSCGGTLVASGTTSINVSPAATTTYYARSRIVATGVVSRTCTPITVTVGCP